MKETMSAPPKSLALPGSERVPMIGARELGPANPDQQLEVTIRLRSARGIAPALAEPSAPRAILSRAEFAERHGATQSSMEQIETFARQRGLNVKEKSAARRTVILSGTVAAMNEAFGTELKEYQYPHGAYRGRTGPIHIPAELQGVIEGVFGLDNRPQAKPHFRRRSGQSARGPRATNLSFTPPQVASLYNFPTGVDGSGTCIAMIELGGGYTDADLSSYWSQLGLTKTPTVTALSVGQGHNNPGVDPLSADVEVGLDIEIAGAVAPGAKIVVYFGENSDAGFLNAITAAVHDDTNKPSIISISWGGPESFWTQQLMTSMDQAFQDAAAMGVTVLVASGDAGSSDGVNDGFNHVDFPASSPNVVACGGTNLLASGGTITSETVWNELANQQGATGGGVSNVFPLPAWQSRLNVPPSGNPSLTAGRGVPDVAGDADPTTGFLVLVNGQTGVVGGTSAVAPLWAGLIALINQSLRKPCGFVNPLLYQAASTKQIFNSITLGNNGYYSAAPGWNPCTGLGSPIGIQVAAALGVPPVAQAAKTAT